MAIDIVVPALGESITEGTIAAWLKKEGDALSVDEPVVELETDKATIEIGAPAAGVLREIVTAEGEDVEVGAVLGRIDPDASVTIPTGHEKVSIQSSDSVGGDSSGSRAGRVPIGDDGSVGLADLLLATGSRVDLSRLGPAVRKRIAELGIDPAKVKATGRDGRLTLDDIERFAVSTATATTAARSPVSFPTHSPEPTTVDPQPEREERVRMTRMRRTIAARLKDAQNTAAILTTFNEADMGAVKDLRARHGADFEKRHGVRLGFTAFFAKACVAALKAFRNVNARIEGNEIVYQNAYDIGMAVSTDDGLLVPVIRDCDAKSFADIERNLAELAGRAREGSLGVSEMEGGTFSITNGGVFGSLQSTPILNPPQSAILGLHKIQDRPVAVEGEVVIRPMMYLALSYDHRIIDGRDAVRFLVRVKDAIENPERLLLDL